MRRRGVMHAVMRRMRARGDNCHGVIFPCIFRSVVLLPRARSVAPCLSYACRLNSDSLRVGERNINKNFIRKNTWKMLLYVQYTVLEFGSE